MQFPAENIETPSPLGSVMNAKYVSTLPVSAYNPKTYLQTIATAFVPNLSMFYKASQFQGNQARSPEARQI